MCTYLDPLARRQHKFVKTNKCSFNEFQRQKILTFTNTIDFDLSGDGHNMHFLAFRYARLQKHMCDSDSDRDRDGVGDGDGGRRM